MSVPIFNLFPPELIADEYIRHNKDNKILYIFYDTKHKDYKDHYKQIFENETCKCAEMFEITTYDRVKEDIDFIINEQSHDEKDCFMLLFLGSIKDKEDKADDKPDNCDGSPDDKPNIEEYETNDRPIKDIEIWRPFANSQKIKYRPKIFIFHAFQEDKNSIQFDSRRAQVPHAEPTATYEIPSEADVLIVYKKTSYVVSDCREIPYFKNLTKNLQEFGHRDDLVNILTYTKCGKDKDFHPLIVSTLRKKVYMTDSEHRSHWYDIRNQMEDNFKKLTELQQDIHKHLEDRQTSSSTTAIDGKIKSNYVQQESVDSYPSMPMNKLKRDKHRNVRSNEPSAYTSIYYFVIILSIMCVFFSIVVALIVK